MTPSPPMIPTVVHPNQKARWNGFHLSEALKDHEIVVIATQSGIYVSRLWSGLVAADARFIRFCACNGCVQYRLNRGKE